MSQRDLARAVGAAQTAVSKWEQGQWVPRPARITMLEHTLGLERGTLSRILGHEPLDEDSDSGSTVLEAAATDPLLGEEERALLAAFYEDLVRRRADQGGPERE